MLINNYNWGTALTTTVAGYDYVDGVQGTVETPGLAAQGNPDPVNYFNHHRVVQIGDTIYDPSYGKTFASEMAWEAAALAGVANENERYLLSNGEWSDPVTVIRRRKAGERLTVFEYPSDPFEPYN